MHLFVGSPFVFWSSHEAPWSLLYSYRRLPHLLPVLGWPWFQWRGARLQRPTTLDTLEASRICGSQNRLHQSLSFHLRRNFHSSWEIDGCAQQTATGQFLPCMARAGCGSRVYESLRAKLWSQDRGPPVGFDGTFRGRRWKTWLRYAAPKASQHWKYSCTAQSKFAKGSCCTFCFGHSTRARWKAEEWKM